MNQGQPPANKAPSGAPVPERQSSAGRAKTARIVPQHLYASLPYLGFAFLLCVVPAPDAWRENLMLLALGVYWVGLGAHAIVALVLMGGSALNKDWRALGQHALAVVVVAAVAGAACFVNVSALGDAGGL